MNVLSLPCLVMASICFYVGAYYLYFFAKRPQVREHLPFAVLCLSVGMYDVFSFGLYNAQSIYVGIFWQKLQIDTLMIMAASLLWFAGVFTEQKRNRILQLLIACFLVSFVVLLFVGPQYTLSPANPDIKYISLFGSLKITYYEGACGVAYQAAVLSGTVAYIYLFYLLIRYFLHTGRKGLFLIICGQAAYFCGILNDSLIAWHVYSSLYLSEYSFFLIIISMAYVLLDKFVNLHTAFEELNAELETKVVERTSKIDRLNEELKHLAERDGLTGIYNRRFFDEYFEIEVKRAKNFMEHKAKLQSTQENEMNFGLAIIDVDHFKTINDTYGHLVGDSLLKQVTDIMKKNMFTRDVLCRYGGDEFVVLLTKTSRDGILQAAEKMRREIAEHAFVLDGSNEEEHVTISVGLVNFDEVPDLGSIGILKVADDRLLMAKGQGRNRIVYCRDA